MQNWGVLSSRRPLLNLPTTMGQTQERKPKRELCVVLNPATPAFSLLEGAGNVFREVCSRLVMLSRALGNGNGRGSRDSNCAGSPKPRRQTKRSEPTLKPRPSGPDYSPKKSRCGRSPCEDQRKRMAIASDVFRFFSISFDQLLGDMAQIPHRWW